MSALVELFGHKTWATAGLLEFCAKLGDDVLDATTPGTYGSIRDTFHHLVRAEEGYFARITGQRFFKPLERDQHVRLDELAARIKRLGPEWEALANDSAIADRVVTTDDGWRLKAAIIMAQAVHHADDHRTHILSVLSARGVEGPDLDVWAYAGANGKAEHVEATKQ